MPYIELALSEGDPGEPEAAALIAALDAYLRDLYPGLPIHALDPAEFRGGESVFLLGRAGGVAVACGAVRPLGGGACELKRMYLRPEYRRRGYSRAMLAALERIAVERGWRTIRLETGVRQPEAMALFESAGYRPIPVYGGYHADPLNRYFEKSIPA